MKKKIISLVLVLTMVVSTIVSGIVYVNAEEDIMPSAESGTEILDVAEETQAPDRISNVDTAADENSGETTDDMEEFEDKDIDSAAALGAEINKLADSYTDKFIIKNNNEKISDKAINKAYSEAKDNKVQTISEIKQENEEAFSKIDIDNSYGDDEVSISENARNMLSSIDDGPISADNIILSDVGSNSVSLTLPETVNPNVFVDSLGTSLGNNAEYIQPDYKLEVSDFEDENSLEYSVDEQESDDNIIVDVEIADNTASMEANDELNTEINESPEAPDNSPNTPETQNNFTDESEVIETEIPEVTETEVPTENETPAPEATLFPNVDIINSLQDDIQTAWQITKGENAKIAVIDGKVDITHPDLMSHITSSYDVHTNSEIIFSGENIDQYYHGTHITGIIASTVPEAEIIPIAAFENGQAYTSDIIKAIEYAKEQGAEIVNCSFGSTDNNQALKEAMENSGLLFVCAAGNNRVNVDETPIYPASFDMNNIISVTSLNEDMGLSYYSNYGYSVDIAMYGRNVKNTLPGGEYGELSGTSMSAAYVTAAAAMAKSADSETDIKERILNSAVSLSNLQDKVAGGKKLSYSNIVYNITSEDIVEVYPEDDFNVDGYVRTPDENWELFKRIENLSIKSGNGFVLYLKEDGTVWATGSNTYGTLGDGSSTNSTIPVQVVGLKNIKQIDCNNHCLAVDGAGKLYAWGYNGFGQLGDGTKVSKCLPVAVNTYGYAVDLISVSENSSVFRTTNNFIYGTGNNEYGQFGNNDEGTYTNPVRCDYWSSISNIKKIEASHKFVMALYNDGTVYACGNNVHYMLGRTGGTINKPLIVPGISDVEDIAVGLNHTLVLKKDDTVWGWGANLYYQLGLGTGQGNNEDKSSAVQVPISDVKELAVYYNTNFAVKNDGSVWAWGSGSRGYSGLGYSYYQSPKQVNISNVNTVCAGTAVLAIENSGTMWAWGINNGAYGNGSTKGSIYPTKLVKGAQSYNSCAIGHDHVLVLNNYGKVYVRGNNSSGQFGNGTTNSTYTETLTGVPGLSDIVEVAAGYGFSVALKKDGTVWTWGSNGSGQLGDGTTENSSSPKQVLDGVASIAAGDYHVVALMTSGRIMTWGSGSNGKLGNGSTSNVKTPTLISNIANVSEVYANGNKSAVLTSDGKVYTFGSNTYGEAGVNSTANYVSTPTLVQNMGNITELSMGSNHMIAVDSYGNVYTWGSNNCGQLGLGSTGEMTYNTPQLVKNGVDIVRAGGDVNYVKLKNGNWEVIGYDMYHNNTPTSELNKFVDITVSPTICIGEKDDAGVKSYYYWGLKEISVGKYNSSATPKQIALPINIDDVFAGEDFLYALSSNKELYSLSSMPSGTSITHPSLLTRKSAIRKVAIGKDAALEIDGLGNVYAYGHAGSSQFGKENKGTISYTKLNIPIQMNDIAEGNGFSVFLGNDGCVYTVGSNANGKLGRPDEGTNNVITKVPGLGNIISISAGYDFAIALRSDGNVYAWGSNEDGQLGTADISSSYEPVLVMSGCKAISAGRAFALAVANDGTLWGWGDNATGQLGINNKDSQKAPICITTATSQGAVLKSVTSIAAGYSQSLAVANGIAYAWGYAKDGQLGNGSYNTALVPKQVTGVTGVTKVVGGHGFSALVTSSKKLWVFGDNSTYCFNNYITTPVLLNLDSTVVPGSQSKTISINCETGKEYIIRVKAQNVENLANTTFTLEYDSNVLQSTNNIAQSYLPMTTGTHRSITIKSNAAGKLSFANTRSITPSKVYNGYINSVRFKAKTTGTTNIKLSY